MSHELGYKKTAWYRVLQFFRVVAYGLGGLVSWILSAAQPSYTYTNYVTGTTTTVPGTPFNWITFTISALVCVMVIELTESTVVYLFSARPVSETIPEKFAKFLRFME